MRDRFDIAVVGSGPAGASTAIRLAKQGISVCIVEKKTLPRYKTCGGGILRRAVRLLETDISPAIERECRQVDLNLSDRLRFRAERDAPIVTMVMRDRFDHLLVQSAIERGVKLVENFDVSGISGTTLHDSKNRSIQSRFIIAADGAKSTVSRLAGFADGRRMVPALECEVAVSPQELTERIIPRFDFDVVSAGYAWSFPKKNHLSIGVLSLRSDAVNLNEAFANYLRHLELDSPRSIERHGFVIPLSPRSGAFAKDGIFLTGDSAGFADPITAEGITAAIQSGQAAADAIALQLHSGFDAEDAYNNWVTHRMLPELRRARCLARLLYRWPRLRDLAFSVFGRKLVDLMTRVVMGETDYGLPYSCPA